MTVAQGPVQTAVRGPEQVAVGEQEDPERIGPVDDAVAAVGEQHIAPGLLAGVLGGSVVLQADVHHGGLERVLGEEVRAERRQAGVAMLELARSGGVQVDEHAAVVTGP